MYGEVAKLGAVVPSINTVTEPEFWQALPADISLHVARLPLSDGEAESVTAMLNRLETALDLLGTAEPDIVTFACTTGSMTTGVDAPSQIETRIENVSGCPGVATAASVRHALDRLDAGRIVLVTPYAEGLVRVEVSFFEKLGLEIADQDHLGITESLEMPEIPADQLIDQVTNLDYNDADAIFVSCTNYPTFPVIEEIEQITGLPVVTSNQATLWDVLRRLDRPTRICGPGQLFEKVTAP